MENTNFLRSKLFLGSSWQSLQSMKKSGEDSERKDLKNYFNETLKSLRGSYGFSPFMRLFIIASPVKAASYYFPASSGE